jgi:hydroxymethylpyrimidine/phosphomethylpyrimidine kinase
MDIKPTNPATIALTVAGSDSGGGAGIQADLKTFAALGMFGTSAITAITAQNPRGVTRIQGIDPDVVAAQIAAVLDYFPVAAVKVGMLFSTEVIHAVAEALRAAAPPPNATRGQTLPPIVVDPVMVSTSGARLLSEDAVSALVQTMLPLASIVTPNMDEAALLAGRPVERATDLDGAAKALYDRLGVPVLVKGGHLQHSTEAVDVLWDGHEMELYSAPFLKGIDAHGTGCTLSSAIAVYLSHGYGLADAVGEAKTYLHQALMNAVPVGPSTTLNHAYAPMVMGS